MTLLNVVWPGTFLIQQLLFHPVFTGFNSADVNSWNFLPEVNLSFAEIEVDVHFLVFFLISERKLHTKRCFSFF